MSRPHFLADNDLNDAIVMGVLRREPTIEFARLRDLGLATRADPEVLDHAAREKWIVVSHDVNTMREAACTCLLAGLSMSGFACCPPAHSGFCHHREPASHLVRERSGGMGRPGRVLAPLTPVAMYGLIDSTEIAERCGPFRRVQRDVSGSARNPGRVDRGGCPPRPPTDPGLHITRTRFLIS